MNTAHYVYMALAAFAGGMAGVLAAHGLRALWGAVQTWWWGNYVAADIDVPEGGTTEIYVPRRQPMFIPDPAFAAPETFCPVCHSPYCTRHPQPYLTVDDIKRPPLDPARPRVVEKEQEKG